MTVTPNYAEQAADLLGIDVFDLGVALQRRSHEMFLAESDRARDYENPNFGNARRLLRAAQACDEAWHMVREAIEQT